MGSETEDLRKLLSEALEARVKDAEVLLRAAAWKLAESAVIGGIPRIVANPRRFIFDVGTDGFNAYEKKADGLHLFAASSSASTFMKISDAMESVMRSNGNVKGKPH